MASHDGKRPAAAIAQVNLLRWSAESRAFGPLSDHVAVEAPLEIRVGDETLATTMRTPGNDAELVAGLLWAESVLSCAADLQTIDLQPSDGSTFASDVAIATVSNTASSKALASAKRGTLTTGACGVCGRGAVDDLIECLTPVAATMPPPERLSTLTDLLRTHQAVFAKTGGLHAAALVDVHGVVRVAREDVGRHNAVDKVIGRCVLDQAMPGNAMVLVVSGRTSFEIVQKAIRAGVGVVVGVSAPSSLAIALAERFGVLLIGFARGGSFNLYTQLENVA